MSHIYENAAHIIYTYMYKYTQKIFYVYLWYNFPHY